jgi:hypothetical protein
MSTGGAEDGEGIKKAVQWGTWILVVLLVVASLTLSVASVWYGWNRAQGLTTEIIKKENNVTLNTTALVLREHYARASVAYGVSGALLAIGVALTVLGLQVRARARQQESNRETQQLRSTQEDEVRKLRAEHALAEEGHRRRESALQVALGACAEQSLAVADAAQKARDACADTSRAANKAYEAILPPVLEVYALAQQAKDAQSRFVAEAKKEGPDVLGFVARRIEPERGSELTRLEDVADRPRGEIAWELVPGALCVVLAGALAGLAATNEPTFSESSALPPEHYKPSNTAAPNAGAPQPATTK